MNGCMCSIHILKGAFIIAIFGVCLSSLICGWCLFFHSFFFLSVGGLSFLCYLTVIVASYSETGPIYWLFFLFMPLVMIAEFVFSLITFFVHGSAMFLDSKELESDNDIRLIMRLYPEYFFNISEFTLGFGLFMFIAACFQIYFYNVIIRAYRYTRKVQNYPPPLSFGWDHRI